MSGACQGEEARYQCTQFFRSRWGDRLRLAILFEYTRCEVPLPRKRFLAFMRLREESIEMFDPEGAHLPAGPSRIGANNP